MPEIKSVAIAGASGNLGPAVLKGLVDAGFQITVLTRAKKPGVFDASLTVLEVDFTSLESMTSALKGIDAVVSTVAGAAAEGQKLMVDAAIAAGVKRFIPSEFGSCTTSPKVQDLPVYSTFAKVRNYLQEKAAAGQITWTVLSCGAFMSFLLDHPTLVDFANHKATLMDDGNNRVSSTSLPKIGKAIAAILKNYDATMNKVVHTSEIIVTQNQVLNIAKEAKPEIEWDIKQVKTSDMLKAGLQSISQGDFGMPVIMNILGGTVFGGEEYGSAFDENDNKLLGIEELSKEDFKKIVEQKVV